MIKKLPDILTDDEVSKLLKQFNKRYITSYRNMLMIKLALKTGMRISEVLKLQWEDLTPEIVGTRIHIREGKGGKDRIIYMNPDLYEEILSYNKKFDIPQSGLIFSTIKGDMIKDSYIRRLMKEKAAKAGINKNVHFHTLRHTALTNLYRLTKDLRVVQQAAGHSNISTTTIYTHISGEDVKEAMLGL